jgi:hypothetical protein
LSKVVRGPVLGAYWDNPSKGKDRTCERISLDYLKLYTTINSKWIKDLNLRTIAIKLLKENIKKYSLTPDLAMISWIWHKKYKS